MELLPVPEGHEMVITHLYGLFSLWMWADDQRISGERNIKRKLPRYVTIARLYDQDGTLVSRGQAICSHRDNPSRKLGRIIAHNRCVKAFGSEV